MTSSVHRTAILLQSKPTVRLDMNAGNQVLLQQESAIPQVMNVLRRRWRVVAICALAGVCAVLALTAILFPRYTAKAQIVFELPKWSTGGQDRTVGAIDDAAVDSQVAAIASDASLARILGSFWTQAQEKGDGSGLAAKIVQSYSLDDLGRHLNVFKELHSRVISVTFSSKDPALAAAVANRAIEVYLAHVAKQTEADRKTVLKSLDKRTPVARAELEQAQARLQDYRVGGSSAKSELRLSELQQEVTTARELYNGLIARKAQLLERKVLPDVRVLSRAGVPEVPSSPNPKLLILPALIFAAGFGGVLAVFMEKLDYRLRSEQEIRDSLGIPCIGVLPRVRFKQKLDAYEDLQKSDVYRHLQQKPFPPYGEAVRSIVATALQIGREQAPPQVFLVTSSNVGEGKSTLAASFAAYAASLDRKVLLIDFWSRRTEHAKKPSPSNAASAAPTVPDSRSTADLISASPPVPDGHPTIDLISAATFLAASRSKAASVAAPVLDGQPMADLISAIPEMGIDYCLPLSRGYVDAVKLIASGQMQSFFDEIRPYYGCVVIDSKPIFDSTETRLLAAMADKVVFAVEWGSRPDIPQNALRLLREALGEDAFESRVAGVMTQVPLKKDAKYHRGDFGEPLSRMRSAAHDQA
jgi:polysaccharide biosynthesis transport protein